MTRFRILLCSFIIGAVSMSCGGARAKSAEPSPAPPSNLPDPAPSGSGSLSKTGPTQGEMTQGTHAIEQGAWAEAKSIFGPLTVKEPRNAEAQYYLGVAF